MAVYDKAYELARELKGSEEYKEYQKAKQAILENPQALSILREYRTHQLAAQSAILTGKELDEKQKAALGRIQEIVNMHGPVKRFIEAEERVLVVLADIQKILQDAMNLLDYMQGDTASRREGASA
ncbi:MAG: YlbF family regulator [Candidatus Fermentithermobacillus carboniphilus]|uniref:YlbF family regulator n=1 Tax=Candidatus Fermentithermobacillus carboniphilus TaxID=3085328 RepID=A0AAT9LBW7_9FIRM|nr:MAG: YlbF family regulator [Candidatus Fermentithermobacillus carboniphilus]